MTTTTSAAAAGPAVLADWPLEIDFDTLQGSWTEEQYLRVSDQTNRLVELRDGILEVLPLPNRQHQDIIGFLYVLLRQLLHGRGGKVAVAAFPLQLRPGKFREPDVLLLLDKADPRNQPDFWRGADLVIEIVSPKSVRRDTRTKRREYAEAGIPEYWLVNPLDETITVLTLAGKAYAEHGVFGRGGRAASVLLREFSVAVDEVLDAE